MEFRRKSRFIRRRIFYPVKIEDQLVAEYFYCKDNNLKYDCEEWTTDITQDKIDAILSEQMK